jgi:hypothetical protein
MNGDQLIPQEPHASTSEQGRLPYHAPELRRHGKVEELTHLGDGTSQDFDGETYDTAQVQPTLS